MSTDYTIADLLGEQALHHRLTDPRYIREDIRASLDAWGKGQFPYFGGFLGAVLSNNLIEACSRADEYNLLTLPAIVAYVSNELPGQCHGSREKVKAWADGIREEQNKERNERMAQP